MRYSRKGDPKFFNTSISINKDIHEKIMEYKKKHRFRNNSYTIEVLIIKGLESEGYIIEEEWKKAPDFHQGPKKWKPQVKIIL